MVPLEIVIKNGMNVNINYREKAIDSVKEYLRLHLIEKDINKKEIYIIFDAVDAISRTVRVMLGSYQTPKYVYCYIYTGDDKPAFLEIYLKDDVFCIEEI